VKKDDEMKEPRLQSSTDVETGSDDAMREEPAFAEANLVI